MPSTKASSGIQFFPGQASAVASNVFAPGGVFSQFMAGKPNAGFDRAQNVGLQQLGQRQAQLGMSGQPLATRQNMDFLTKTTQGAGDNFMSTLFNFMQPAGSTSKSVGGIPGMMGGIGKG